LNPVNTVVANTAITANTTNFIPMYARNSTLQNSVPALGIPTSLCLPPDTTDATNGTPNGFLPSGCRPRMLDTNVWVLA